MVRLYELDPRDFGSTVNDHFPLILVRRMIHPTYKLRAHDLITIFANPLVKPENVLPSIVERFKEWPMPLIELWFKDYPSDASSTFKWFFGNANQIDPLQMVKQSILKHVPRDIVVSTLFARRLTFEIHSQNVMMNHNSRFHKTASGIVVSPTRRIIFATRVIRLHKELESDIPLDELVDIKSLVADLRKYKCLYYFVYKMFLPTDRSKICGVVREVFKRCRYTRTMCHIVPLFIETIPHYLEMCDRGAPNSRADDEYTLDWICALTSSASISGKTREIITNFKKMRGIHFTGVTEIVHIDPSAE